MPPTPLPAPFLTALDGRDELLVASREGSRVRAVPAWFVLGSGGDLYLFAEAHSLRARRWQADPWVRLTVPGSAISIEGIVHAVAPDELDPALSDLVVERWGMWGAATPQGLRRMLRDGSHLLLRVEAR